MFGSDSSTEEEQPAPVTTNEISTENDPTQKEEVDQQVYNSLVATEVQELLTPPNVPIPQTIPNNEAEFLEDDGLIISVGTFLHYETKRENAAYF